MRARPDDYITIYICRENSKAETATFIDASLDYCFNEITTALSKKKIKQHNAEKTNFTKLIFREYKKKKGHGKSKIYKFKGMSPEEVFIWIVDKFY